MATTTETSTTETPIAIGLLIPENIRNDFVEIIGIWNIHRGVVYYNQCDLPLDDEAPELDDFGGEGIYVNNKIIDEQTDYLPLYHSPIE